MSEPNYINDTIAAISTPPGVGGIGIVRLSGPGALAVAGRIFEAADNTVCSQWRSHTVRYGRVIDPEASPAGDTFVDEALLTVMLAPRSYTREDVVELSCHGGAVSVRAVLNLALKHGARLAEPGEFTRRAFLNGRLDLTQAEAVLDVINSATESFLKVSTNQLKGALTRELEAVRERLMDIYAQLEAAVNFPEEDTGGRSRRDLLSLLESAQQTVDSLLQTGEQGRLLKDGIKIVICGKPNVGKSSLLNVLLREPRAIVSPIEGTTRDTIEESVQIGGIPFRLVDTAGMLEPRDVVEEEAVKRSRLSIKSADLVLLMLDAGTPVSAEDRRLIDAVKGQDVLIVVNKCDLEKRLDLEEVRPFFAGEKIIPISALKNTGIDGLQAAMVERALHGRAIDTNRALVSNARHLESLRRCAGYLQEARGSLCGGLSPEFVSEDLQRAVNELDVITGRRADHDLLEKIFARFCIGK